MNKQPATRNPQRIKILIFLLLFSLISSGCFESREQKGIQSKSFKPSKIVYDEWMGAYFQGKKIGYIHSVTEEGLLDDEPSVRVKSYARIEMDIEGEKSFTELDQTGYLDRSGRLSAFEYNQEIMGHIMAVRGERQDGDLVVEVNAGGDKRVKVFPYEDNLYTSGLMKHAVMQKGLTVGKELTFNILLEPLLAVEPVKIKILSLDRAFIDGKETNIYTLEESFKGITGSLRLTSEGQTLDETSPQGFKLLSVKREEALKEVKALSIVDLLLASRIEVERPLKDPGTLKRLKLRLKKFPVEFPVIEDERQKVLATEKGRDGVNYLLQVDVKALPEEDAVYPVNKRLFALHLKADHVINSDNELIIKKAKEIVGRERSALRAAERLYRWVYKNIDKKLIDTVSAVDTLESGEGECQAHANLFAALARSVGISTKVISGIVYSEKLEGFMYHAWNEVYAGKWVSVDPTLGGFPADATHIKVAEGGLAEQLKIMALVGRVEVEDIEVN